MSPPEGGRHNDIRHQVNNNNNALIEKITKSKKINKLLCTIQINNNTDKINERIWIATLQVDTIDWKKIYQTIFQATLDTSLPIQNSNGNSSHKYSSS